MGGSAIVGIVGLLVIVFGWQAFQRRQEVAKVTQRGPVLVEQGGNRYRVTFTVRPVPILASGLIGQFFPPDYLYGSIHVAQGDGWQFLAEPSVPFTAGYYGRWETQQHTYGGDRLDGIAAQLVADTLNPPRHL